MQYVQKIRKNSYQWINYENFYKYTEIKSDNFLYVPWFKCIIIKKAISTN